MAVRMCPHCKTEIPALEAAAQSDSIVCPKCGARLEVSSGSRMIASLWGLAAGTIVWRASSGLSGDLGGVLPTLYAFLAFGIVSPLALMVTASLRKAPTAPAPEPAHASSADEHGAGGHGGGHH